MLDKLPAPTQEPSPTAGMNIAQRILHVGGRNNAAGYVEFGSTQAVEALVHQVLRDLPTPTKPAQHECTSINQGCGVIIQKRSVEEATDAWNKRVSDITPPPIETAIEGMSLVPDQPTQLMRDAGNKALDMLETTPGMLFGDRSYYAYRAMLATANPLMHANQSTRRPVEYISAEKQPLTNEELARTLISLKRQNWKL